MDLTTWRTVHAKARCGKDMSHGRYDQAISLICFMHRPASSDVCFSALNVIQYVQLRSVAARVSSSAT